MAFFTRWGHEVEIKAAEWIDSEDPRAAGEIGGIFALVSFTGADPLSDRWYPVSAMRADGGLGELVETIDALTPGLWDLAREKWAEERRAIEEPRIGRPDGVTNPHLYDIDGPGAQGS